ncbi:MAG: hypothetical protein KC649_02870, partial [Candidatus Omnitrophica bacterium]|nr:hypothetical protein [Candidatus Omnitrophota bacterium]
ILIVMPIQMQMQIQIVMRIPIQMLIVIRMQMPIQMLIQTVMPMQTQTQTQIALQLITLLRQLINWLAVGCGNLGKNITLVRITRDTQQDSLYIIGTQLRMHGSLRMDSGLGYGIRTAPADMMQNLANTFIGM